MKVTCDCGAEVYNQKQAPIGEQPGRPDVTINVSAALWFTISKEHAPIQRLLEIVCGACKRTFIMVDVVP
jgi:hypothetical protein